jgi:predicted TIM-barrel fold metal-dependent hydrolase
LRDIGFENALYRAYHRWVVDFCAQAPTRLKWTLVANMRNAASGVAELENWAERDPNLVGVYISPQAPGGKLLDNPDLYPLYDAAQNLDMPLLAHGGTARPPHGPGTRDLDGALHRSTPSTSARGWLHLRTMLLLSRILNYGRRSCSISIASSKTAAPRCAKNQAIRLPAKCWRGPIRTLARS